MKINKGLIIAISLLLILVITSISISLIMNKTFFKTEYIGVDGKVRFIPKYSYFESECCMTVANFYSLKSEKELKDEITNYMNGFEFFDDESTYGYMKDDIFIQKYNVVNHGVYRTIHITY